MADLRPASRGRSWMVLVAALILALGYRGDAVLDQVLSPRSSLTFMLPSQLLTIDQRVDKILAHTPLLGESQFSFFIPVCL